MILFKKTIYFPKTIGALLKLVVFSGKAMTPSSKKTLHLSKFLVSSQVLAMF